MAVFIGQADMNVHATARKLGKRFGHKTCDQAVAVGNAFDQALEHDRFVSGLQGVGAMGQREFELPRRVFADRRLSVVRL